MTVETRAKATPGPWMAFVADGRTFIGTERAGERPTLVAEIWNPADAPLLLAAPAMLAALEAVSKAIQAEQVTHPLAGTQYDALRVRLAEQVLAAIAAPVPAGPVEEQ